MRRSAGTWLVALLLGANPVHAGPDCATFTSEGLYESSAAGLSRNGAVVVGTSDFSVGINAFRWIPDGEAQLIGGAEQSPAVGGGVFGIAHGASDDGSVAVGEVGSEVPARWIADGDGMTIATPPAIPAPGVLYDVSTDGTALVGAAIPDGALHLRALLWTEAGGLDWLPDLPEGLERGHARALSEDGATAVGVGFGATGDEAVRWTLGESVSALGLGRLPGGDQSGATDVSMDGSVVVGWSESTNGRRAFRWTAGSGMQDLGTATALDDESEALGVSGDGSIVVGRSGGLAFVWDATLGMRPLRQALLDDCGLDIFPWQLTGVAGISSDGRTIAGSGTLAPMGDDLWRVVLPEPGALAGGLAATSALALVGRRRMQSRYAAAKEA